MHPLATIAVRVPLVCAAAALCIAAPRAQSFAYEKYVLDNGMTVILHEDHALPTVTINTWFRVGSKDELPGRSGFAHLFEHLMFMGTERVPDNQFDVLMEQGGGRNNASTSEDRTNYFSSGPRDLLPLLLWLDADRLEDVGRTMTQQKLDRQRDIVRNEIRQNVENTPYGRAGERVYRLLYPVGHPYHEAVYGTHADLEAATVDNVKDFFATYYVASNASLVVAGDFEAARIKPLIAQLFGTLPRGAPVARRTAPIAALPGVVRATMLDKVQLPSVRMVWHSPPAYADGDAELVLLGAVLSQGKSSRLYKRMVFDERIATGVAAFQDSLALGSMFTIDVTAAPGADLDRIERTVDEELRAVRERGIEAAELAQQQTGLELGRLSRLQNLGAVADQLNAYEFAFGEPDSFARDLDRFRHATPAGLQSAASATLDPGHRVIVRVLPEQPEHAASARDARPEPAPAGTFTAPVPTTFVLGNGIPVQLFSKRELPLVAMQVLFRTGGVITAPRTAGLAQLTATMLTEGAGARDALAFGDAVQSLGARLAVTASHESAAGSLTVLRRNLAPAVDLLADALRRPRLQTADWERRKALHLDELRQDDDEPRGVAARVGLRALLGDQDPFAWSLDGTTETVSALTLDDVRREHAALFRPDLATILVAGDLGADDAKALFERAFGDWSAAPAAAAPATVDDETTGSATAASSDAHAAGFRVVLVDRPGAVQTVVRLYAPGPRYDDPRRMAHLALGTILGGSFTSRLNQNLREQHGYTYGANSSYAMAGPVGWFQAGADVRADVTGKALGELLGELRRIGGGARGDVGDAEVRKADETIRTESVRSFGSLGGVLGNAAELLLRGRPLSAIGDDLAALRRLSADDLNAMGKDAVALDRAVLVLVGDRATITAQLQDLGLPAPIERDVHGRPVAK
jgi:predicted Zn-dependent peptidase